VSASAPAERADVTRRSYPFEYPFAPTKVVGFFIEYYGPTNRAYGSLDTAGKKAMHDDLTALWSKNNVATDGSTRMLAEYIEVIGTRSWAEGGHVEFTRIKH
jgi:hypothetical protein